MADFILSCCSTADMSKEYFENRNIEYVCFKYLIDGVTYPDDLGQTKSFDEFYYDMEKGAIPTTSQVNAEEYTAYFEKFLKEGKDVLHLCLSSGISGTYNSACIAQTELQEKYPDRKLVVIDSLAASSGFGLLMDGIADKRDAGSSFDECCEWAENNKLNVQHWFFTSDLTYLKRGGRISQTAAFVGQVLSICPLMNVDYEGRLIVREKVRTKRKVIEEMVSRMEQHASDGLSYSGKCFISMSACPDTARTVADLIEERFTNLEGKVIINSIGTVIGSHTGPGTVALFFMGDKRVN